MYYKAKCTSELSIFDRIWLVGIAKKEDNPEEALKEFRAIVDQEDEKGDWSDLAWLNFNQMLIFLQGVSKRSNKWPNSYSWSCTDLMTRWRLTPNYSVIQSQQLPETILRNRSTESWIMWEEAKAALSKWMYWRSSTKSPGKLWRRPRTRLIVFRNSKVGSDADFPIISAAFRQDKLEARQVMAGP